jgi:hypothetical protein
MVPVIDIFWKNIFNPFSDSSPCKRKFNDCSIVYEKQSKVICLQSGDNENNWTNGRAYHNQYVFTYPHNRTPPRNFFHPLRYTNQITKSRMLLWAM